MAFLLVVYIISFITWLAGWLPISGWWFILGPILFIPAVIVFCIAMGIGIFATGVSFISAGLILEKIADKWNEIKRNRLPKKTVREIFEERRASGKKW